MDAPNADEFVLRGTIEPQEVDWDEGASVWLPPGVRCSDGGRRPTW